MAGLGKPPLIEPDEGRNAEVAREMLVSGDWVTPHYNSLTYLDKPPVFFWMVAASFRAWGVSEWSARFPSAMLGLATVLLTWFLTRRMTSGSAGTRAGIVLATAPLAFGLSRLVTFDMALAFLVTLSLGSFWLLQAAAYRSAGFTALMFGAMGAAAITKGPAGFLLPLLSILAYQALRGEFHELKRMRWGLGLAAFLAVSLPWFVAVSIRHPDFPRYAFFEESLKRFATGYARRLGFPGFYVPVYLAGFFPWSIFLLFAGWGRMKRWRELREEAQKPTLFLLSWAGAVFLFFSISRSKLPAYFLPAVVPLSILAARIWGDVETREAGRPPDWLTAGLAAMVGLGLLVAFVTRLPFHSSMQSRLSGKLPPSFVALLKPTIVYSGLILVGLAIVARNLAYRARSARAQTALFALVALATPLLVIRSLPLLRIYASSNSSRRLATTILASSQKDLPIYGYYYFRTGLPFYLRRPVGLVTSDASELTSNYLGSRPVALRRDAEKAAVPAPVGPSASPPARDEPPFEGVALLVFDPAKLKSLAARGPVLVMARLTHLGEVARLAPEVEPLWTEWNCSIWEISAKAP